MQDGVHLEVHSLIDLPLYNGDLDTEGPPDAVVRLREAIRQADGLVLCTPEYNAGTSGVMKNALDWASRPQQNSSLRGKHALIMSASPAFTGGARAHAQLRETLASTLSRVAVHPAVVIPQVLGKLKEGRLIDESNIEFALGAIQALLAEIRASNASVQ
jgi:chromate reductase